MVLIPAVLGLASLVWLLRDLRIRRIESRLERTTRLAPGLERLARVRTEGLAVGAVVTLADGLFALDRIDPELMTAIDRSHGASGIAFDDLVERVERAHEGGSEVWEGLLSNYKGYLGEHRLAVELEARGHVVELADTSNQEGWDALVDGQPVQFKVGLDTGGIEAHLEAHPDIPVITVAEHAGVFADQADVDALLPVSGEEVHQATEAGLEGIEDIGDLPLDFPLVTAVFSGKRHFGAVARGDSDGTTALQRTMTDTAVVGGGAMAGAKAGAAVGALGGPVGAIVGAVLGGLAAGRYARRFANEINQAELRRLEKRLFRRQWVQRRLEDAYANSHQQALAAKAAVLNRRAAALSSSRSFWPSMREIAREHVARRYREWALHCSGSAGGRPTDPGREPAFSAQLSDAWSSVCGGFERLAALANEVDREGRSLGLSTRHVASVVGQHAPRPASAAPNLSVRPDLARLEGLVLFLVGWIAVAILAARWPNSNPTPPREAPAERVAAVRASRDASVATEPNGTVNVEVGVQVCRLRERPSVTHRVVARLERGTLCREVGPRSGDWYDVECTGNRGYVHQVCLTD